MHSPYGLDIIESCVTCPLRADHLFCNLPVGALNALERIKSTAAYPKGALLFMEGQAPRGIFVLCNGRAKLSTSSSDGKTIILKIAEPGEVLGLSATVSGKPYEATVEMLEPAQANFISREDFQQFLREYGDAAVRVAQQLSHNYHSAYQEIRCLGLSNSASEKLAKLLLDWAATMGHPNNGNASEIRVKLTVTHEEIAQMIGSSRETVTRLLSDFRKKQLIAIKGSNLIIRNKPALEKMTVS